ncbi:MAG: carbohydrate ABC transporter permease [Candidatus Bathyarchaeia archaeon]
MSLVNAKRFLAIIAVAIIAVVFIFPIYFTVVTSLSGKAYISQGSLIPDFYLGNWRDLFTLERWVRAIRNSLIIAAGCVGLGLILCIPAAYVFARIKFGGDRHFFFWLLTNRMAPPVALSIPYLIMFKSIGIWDTHYGAVLAYMVFNIPIGIWLLASFIITIPKEIDYAAFLDGYSLWMYFRKILLPALKPGISVTAFFIWMYSWNEMFMASVITSANAKTLTAELLTTVGRLGWGIEYGVAAAGAIITLVPGLVLLYWARRVLIKGFTFGRL